MIVTWFALVQFLFLLKAYAFSPLNVLFKLWERTFSEEAIPLLRAKVEPRRVRHQLRLR